MNVEQMLSQIKEYQARLGYTYRYETMDQRMEHIRALTLAQFMEVSEFIDWTPWKPWRAVEDQKFNMKEAGFELIDQFFFLANLWAAIGLKPEDFPIMFREKLNENLDRIERGYNKTTETSKQGELKL